MSVWTATAAVALLLLAGCGDGSADSASSSAAPQSSNSPPPTRSALPGPSTSSASLDWAAPTTNTNGSALTNLGGYKIYYGTSSSRLSSTITISNPGLLTYMVEGLPIGTTYYFAIVAVTTGGVESADSAVVSMQIS
ncbi:MAG TPA: fibronectin type III domain-containing protein [Steroidobacteraceae bacterium]|nr:fibronectin type III domain-containing protein [Steroidobacteraceae bacterium]